MNLSRILPFATLVAVLLSACSSANKTAKVAPTSSKSDGKFFVVSVESAAFFRHGPQAGREADKMLARETVVKVIRPSFGYSKVELVSSGEQGYVASEEIRPSSGALVASAVTTPPVNPLANPLTTTSPAPAVEQFHLNSDDPRLVPPPEDLPADAPAPAPEQ